MIYINSTQFLEFIGKNDCLILFEKATPAGKLKREMITLTTAGRPPCWSAIAIRLSLYLC